MKSVYEWLACLGIALLLGTWAVSQTAHGAVYVWEHFMGFALGIAMILSAAILYQKIKK